VLVLDARYTLVGASRLASLLRRPRRDHGEIHLVGHSVGGAAVLAYLAGWRAGLLPPPAARVRTVVTLDAAVSGLAGVWSGARRYFASASEAQLNGLNAWAAQRDIALLTAANQRDVWSHRPLSDLPYLGVRLGPASGLRVQLNGTVHGWLRRAPQFVDALWGSGE
jgi:pimeloyl-ACP methyl ester carboxylesterase